MSFESPTSGLGSSSSILTSGVIFTAVVLTCCRLSQGKELIYGRVTRLPKATTPDHLPPSLSLDVRLGGDDVHLNLSRKDQPLQDIPVYELTSDSSGHEHMSRPKLEDTQLVVYRDTEHGSAFSVSLQEDRSGTAYYIMEGYVHSGGKVYDLKTTGRDGQSTRRRRHASGRGDEEEDEKEFEMDIQPDSVYDDAVSLSDLPFNHGQDWRVSVTSVWGDTMSRGETPRCDSLPPVLERKKRQSRQNIYIDIVAVADYGVYNSWYNRSSKSTPAEKKKDTLKSLRQYYAFIFKGIDMLYEGITSLKYTINIRLSSIIVTTTAASSTWTDNLRVSSKPQDKVNAYLALPAFSTWATVSKSLPPYDHIMLFSGYDLCDNTTGIPSDGTAGLAYVGTACKVVGSTSIVEDLGGFRCVTSAAHELAHGLSANHDGGENSCRPEDLYLMTSAIGVHPVTPTNKLNPWKFSDCSVNYFNTFFQQELQSEQGRTCLLKALPTSSNVPDVTSVMAGQLYGPDQQCRQYNGPESFMCRHTPKLPAELCTSMYCAAKSRVKAGADWICQDWPAARGTSCGDRKWCEAGQCVHNDLAPAMDESCMFGDTPGNVTNDKSCAAITNQFPGYCYKDSVLQRCCSSCAKHRINLQNCEYGDRATGCPKAHCSLMNVHQLRLCCGTCNYGTKLPTITTTRAPDCKHGDKVKGCKEARCRSANARYLKRCCGTCQYGSLIPTTTTSRATTAISEVTTPDDCTDDTTLRIHQMSCETFVRANPAPCYSSITTRHCCRSCRDQHTGVAGCEYGDHQPSKCASVSPNSESCKTLTTSCCKTCENYRGGQSPVGAVSIPSLLTPLAAAFLFTKLAGCMLT